MANAFSDSEYSERLYCHCNEPESGMMVGCDNPTCTIEWFHVKCVGMTTIPEGEWICPPCSVLRKENNDMPMAMVQAQLSPQAQGQGSEGSKHVDEATGKETQLF